MTARDGARRLLHSMSHVGAVRDALRIGEDQRRALVRLGFAKRDDRLLVVGAHRDLRDVDVAVRDRHHREVLAWHLPAGGGKLGRSSERRCLRCLSAGIGIDLGVEDEHVDVATGRRTWSSPPDPMSYAQPSPPTIHTERGTR